MGIRADPDHGRIRRRACGMCAAITGALTHASVRAYPAGCAPGPPRQYGEPRISPAPGRRPQVGGRVVLPHIRRYLPGMAASGPDRFCPVGGAWLFVTGVQFRGVKPGRWPAALPAWRPAATAAPVSGTAAIISGARLYHVLLSPRPVTVLGEPAGKALPSRLGHVGNCSAVLAQDTR